MARKNLKWEVSPSLEKRFWAKVKKTTRDGCWPWIGATLANGYGVFFVGTGNTTAHRASYRIANGALKDGLVIDHLCRNRSCCNPLHLEEVTSRENTLRGDKGRLHVKCANGHTFTEETTGRHRSGRRFCLICRRTRDRGRRDASYWREYRRKKKARMEST